MESSGVASSTTMTSISVLGVDQCRAQVRRYWRRTPDTPGATPQDTLMGQLERYGPPEQQEGASPEQREPLLNYPKQRAFRIRIHAHTRRMEGVNNPLRRESAAGG
jgi:hypothetical protein